MKWEMAKQLSPAHSPPPFIASQTVTCPIGEGRGAPINQSLMEVEKACHFLLPDQLGVLESVKAAADVYFPVGGTVAEVNERLDEIPELVNEDPYEKGSVNHTHTPSTT
jgi:hypothetical protein